MRNIKKKGIIRSPSASASPVAEESARTVQEDASTNPKSSPGPASSQTSSTSSTFSIDLPIEIIQDIAKNLAVVGSLKTLSSLSMTSKIIHSTVISILFHDITIRNHSQLSSILSSLDTIKPENNIGRRTRLSGPNCDVEAKLERFRLTKRLSINHFPSLNNLSRLETLQDVFHHSPIFPYVNEFYIAPILMHRLHPATCGKSAHETRKRMAKTHMLRILAHPSHLIVDLRGSETGWADHPSSETPYGCVCIDDFCGRLGKIWTEKGILEDLTVHLDNSIVGSHFLSTTASGPSLHIQLHTTSNTDPSMKENIVKTTRPGSTSSRSVKYNMTDALSAFIFHRVSQASEHLGGKTDVTIPALEGDQEDINSFVETVVKRAKEIAGSEAQALFSTRKAKNMLRALEIKVGDEDGVGASM